MPKKYAFGYGIKHMNMNEWSRENSTFHNDLKGYISHLFLAYID